LSAAGSLLEVAVALPVPGTFTYRDPRPGTAAPIGAQVVVPFGSRTVTGFVVALAAAGSGGAELRDIEEIVAGEPPFDEAMIGFCRFVADYYQAPLGEVLRAALPQGEQANATRAVRLTDAGRRTVGRQQSLIEGGAVDDPVLAALAAAGGELPLRRLLRAVPRAESRLPKMAAAGLVEMGDEVEGRRPPPSVAFAHATGAAISAFR
jgi:primosomal protein N' (replication factor Y) (superfamily II helicase)